MADKKDKWREKKLERLSEVLPEENNLATEYAEKLEEKSVPIIEITPPTKIDTTPTINIKVKKKESKSVRRTYLIKPSTYQKISEQAEMYGLSENELINQVLDGYFK